MAKKDKVKKASDKSKKPNRIVKWFRDLKSEFKKVVWPGKKQVFNNTFVVVATVVICSAFVGAFDYGLLKLFSFLIDLG
ncbi:MAG: preprotein translocase subunit SecE [Oscillospiraceae bacterium]|jgi:preprotein translocase subunit SecE|nr:preprotein translocase subunit SecE [Oscillospiraceae bacterium]